MLLWETPCKGDVDKLEPVLGVGEQRIAGLATGPGRMDALSWEDSLCAGPCMTKSGSEHPTLSIAERVYTQGHSVVGSR